MKTKLFAVLLLSFTLFTMDVISVAMQEGCDTLPPRLSAGQGGQVSFTDGHPLNVRANASRNGDVAGQLPEGAPFDVLEGPVCADDINWWRIQAEGVTGWVAEAAENTYLVEPRVRALPTATPIALTRGVPFAAWNWQAFVGDSQYLNAPDPLAITPPPVYAGNLPALPVELDPVLFVEDANLNDRQRALLARNGFVVVPAGLAQFDDAYTDSETWNSVPETWDYQADPATQPLGESYFVTTDSMLHALHYVFDNLLTDLERGALVGHVEQVLTLGLDAAIEQYQTTLGTPLETPARQAVLYLLVANQLLVSDAALPNLDAALLGEAQAIVMLALAGEGQSELSFLPGYREDFSQYRPRGHYAGDVTLEGYFRAMMWLSRVTFRANNDGETQIALMLVRALRSQPAAFGAWQVAQETLGFLFGPVDDLGLPEYGPLAEQVFGAELTLASLADGAKLAAFRDRLQALPGPRINGLVLPDDTQASDVEDLSRGFRLMGQRFTLDAYVLQQLIYPYVGNRERPRLLPLGLDVPAAIGSDSAYTLAAQAGATDFQNYDTQMASLRGQVASLSQAFWLENTYGGWLWALQPLWTREAASYPPLMNTEAWLHKDLQTGLASWTELKHDSVLYAKQPTGFGGGGPPLASFGYVEPNPLVFARISAVAAITYQGLVDRGIMDLNENAAVIGLTRSVNVLRQLALTSARFAEMARKELVGEALTDEEYVSIQTFGTYLNVLLLTLYQGDGEPDPVALVTDVASNPSVQLVLQEGVGGVDYLYVVIPAPGGRLQVSRGAVFSYYEFTGNINQRMTDEEWRALVQNNALPERPGWVSAFLAE